MLLELHSHTNAHSRCSTITPLDLVKGVLKKGLQGLVITEHHYLWTQDELDALRRQAEISEHFLLFAGQEVETDIGHVVVFGAETTIARFMTLAKLRKAFPEAALMWAHPLRNGKIPTDKELLSPLIDAVEIFSSNHTIQENYYGLNLWHAHKFTALAGSDCHAEGTVGLFPTQFLHPVGSLSDIVREIRNNRCHPFFKEIPKSGSNLQVTEIVFGVKGEDESRNRIVVKKIDDPAKFERKKKALAVIESLHARGFSNKQFRIPRVITVDEKEQAVIEEGQRGKSLYELLNNVSVKVGRQYFSLAGQWLAQLHAVGLRTTTVRDARLKEEKRFSSYHRVFQKVPDTYKHMKGLIEFVQKYELELFGRSGDTFVQSHGDYHPKNIIIGQDMTHDISTLFISVIDFDSTIVLSPAFDVAYFLAQFGSQLPNLSKKYSEQLFLKSYAAIAGKPTKDFLRAIALFKVRANLSIGSFLVKVGKGTGPDMDRLIRYSLRARSQFPK